MKRLVKILMIAALGLPLSAATLSLGGCAKCLRYEDRMVAIEVCERRSSTGYCMYRTTNYRYRNVCVEREVKVKVEAEAEAEAEVEVRANQSMDSLRAEIAGNIQNKLDSETQRINAPSAVASRKGCYRDPTLSCVTGIMDNLAADVKEPHSRSRVLGQVAIAQALAGETRKAFGTLKRSLAEFQKTTDGMESGARDGYVTGLAGAAAAFAVNGDVAASHKALALASGLVPELEYPYQRSRVRIVMASAHFALGERAAAEGLLKTIESNALALALADGMETDTAVDALLSVLEFHIERGQTSEARRIYALFPGLADRLAVNAMDKQDSGAGIGYQSLVRVHLAMGDTRQAGLTVVRLSEVAGAQENELWRKLFSQGVVSLREEIRIAEAGPPFTRHYKTPENSYEWTLLAEAYLAEGDAPAFKLAVGNAMASMDGREEFLVNRVGSLFLIAELLGSPEGKAAERTWTGQPGAALSPPALSPPAVPPGGPRLTLAERIATY